MQRSVRMPAAVRFLLCLAVGILALESSGVDAAEPNEQLALLQRSGIATDTPGVIAYLRRLQPDAKLQQEIAAQIAALSDADFARREAAFKKLSTYGDAARKLLTEATKSKDAEVSWRAGKIVQKLDSEDESRKRAELTMAALEVLKERRAAPATPVILATIGLLSEPYARDAAAAALWACADAPQVEALSAALDHKDIHVRAAAVVALEVAAGEQAVARIAPLLKDKEPAIRLAAARALIDRQPKEAVAALIAIAGEEDGDLAWQADALLRLKTGHRVQLDDKQTFGGAWRQWADNELADAELDRRLDSKRLDLTAGRNTLEESFTRQAASLAKGYGRFLYEADNGGAAKVADGKLHIDGDNPEGDQRLYITSQRMIGRDRWPDALEVRAKLAGEEGNNFGWHIGVSVGRVKVLFHPGLGGGSFRAETTDDHQYIFTNEQMRFDPVTGVMHEMILRVRKTDAGADIDVTVNDGRGGTPHTKKFSVTREQLGKFNRIGLERSGRTGGDALFDSISIRLGT